MKIESIAADQLYGAVRKSLSNTPSTDPSQGVDFASALESALSEMRQTMQTGEKASIEAMKGNGDVQSLVEALTATEMALETATAVRDRVVEAYQEIMRMPV